MLRPSLVFLPLGLAAAASAQNLVVDPGFESATGAAGVATPYTSGSPDGGNWQITYVDPTSTLANVSVDKRTPWVISGNVGALITLSTLSETVPTVANGSYLVQFDAVSGLDDTLNVGFGSSTNSFTVPRFTGQSPIIPVTHYAFLATATSASTSLNFNDSTQFGVELDNVSVTAAPEPSAFAALGLGAVAVLRRRKRA